MGIITQISGGLTSINGTRKNAYVYTSNKVEAGDFLEYKTGVAKTNTITSNTNTSVGLPIQSISDTKFIARDGTTLKLIEVNKTNGAYTTRATLTLKGTPYKPFYYAESYLEYMITDDIYIYVIRTRPGDFYHYYAYAVNVNTTSNTLTDMGKEILCKVEDNSYSSSYDVTLSNMVKIRDGCIMFIGYQRDSSINGHYAFYNMFVMNDDDIDMIYKTYSGASGSYSMFLFVSGDKSKLFSLDEDGNLFTHSISGTTITKIDDIKAFETPIDDDDGVPFTCYADSDTGGGIILYRDEQNAVIAKGLYIMDPDGKIIKKVSGLWYDLDQYVYRLGHGIYGARFKYKNSDGSTWSYDYIYDKKGTQIASASSYPLMSNMAGMKETSKSVFNSVTGTRYVEVGSSFGIRGSSMRTQTTEQQVARSNNKVNAIAITSGKGGSGTEHGDMITIYTP